MRMYCSRIALRVCNDQMRLGRRKTRERHLPIFFLTSGIQNIEKGNFVVDDTLLAVRVWKSHEVSGLVPGGAFNGAVPQGVACAR